MIKMVNTKSNDLSAILKVLIMYDIMMPSKITSIFVKQIHHHRNYNRFGFQF